jgi:hypothetical protein
VPETRSSFHIRSINTREKEKRTKIREKKSNTTPQPDTHTQRERERERPRKRERADFGSELLYGAIGLLVRGLGLQSLQRLAQLLHFLLQAPISRVPARDTNVKERERERRMGEERATDEDNGEEERGREPAAASVQSERPRVAPRVLSFPRRPPPRRPAPLTKIARYEQGWVNRGSSDLLWPVDAGLSEFFHHKVPFLGQLVQHFLRRGLGDNTLEKFAVAQTDIMQNKMERNNCGEVRTFIPSETIWALYGLFCCQIISNNKKYRLQQGDYLEKTTQMRREIYSIPGLKHSGWNEEF